MSKQLKMPYINEVRIAGNLTRAPELKSLPSGDSVCSLNVACTKHYKSKSGDKREDTLFVQVTAFGDVADRAAKELEKGMPVYLEGSLRLETWEDRDGKKQSKTRVDARRILALAWAGQDGEAQEPAGAATGHARQDAIPEDDIPF